ncbi:MAG: tRNA (adenosine(37)-N6)-threonylcarbamoyltransferase complex dimerization subunit type 1 TsaB [Clostridiales bacterium]|jgi:tRNA threonylcarbamoyladenosine biosynthesis protein TsaB|nr:tRNA (adenosine(37)-N6)-threonylcarbamoyltransferase complex dimerization subunit type 1 TsaB [Clostridiales bacterium]
MLVLGLDTCCETCSVAIANDKNLLIQTSTNKHKKRSSEIIIKQIKNILNFSNIKVSEIDFFATTVGPGSFTGTRIGISIIKALSQSLEKKCIPISTLECLANNITWENFLICPTIDAKNDYVYSCFFKRKNKTLVKLEEENIISLSALTKKINNYENKIIFISDEALIYEKLTNLKISNAIMAPFLINSGLASSVVQLSLDKITNNKTINYNEILPLYIKNCYYEN